jgi:thiamine-monophosphate kinase
MKSHSETELIQQIRKLAGPVKNRSIVHSIGDDCAVFRPTPSEDLVFTTDFAMETRHFTLATHTPADIGHKALARSLSDLAAMGAEPAFCLVSLAVPANIAASFVPEFYAGLLALAEQYHTALAGGDLARFDLVIVDVMCCGSVQRGTAYLRSAALPGDSIYVSGALGASALGFRTQTGAAWERHKRPEPRILIGLALHQHGVRCAMDISDGLSLDLARLSTESNVSAELHSPLPLGDGASLADALHGGEDYELLFTASASRYIPTEVGGIPITRIGRITERGEALVTLDGSPLPAEGFDHFS